ncbi:MAG: pitrilysin family protein [Pseudomonadota bacterium]
MNRTDLPRPFLPTFFALAMLMLAATLESPTADAASRVSEFKLDNGMQIIVVPDTRAPVITHMVWYRVGAADEAPGVSGIAHFLEHLMFKSTDKIPMGEFSKIVARLGGQDNAFTSQDATAYFQRISKDRLKDVMAMEADRMVNLRLTEKEVLTERDVIEEERRSRIENSPESKLSEQIDAALYKSHPYGIPVIGWMHEISALTQQDALSFYKRFYAPNNAILVVTGDVVPNDVLELAKETFGKIPNNPAVPAERSRPSEPPHIAARRVTLTDPRAGKASLTRYYLAPSYRTAKDGDAEALEVLMKIMASGTTSRMYRSLVVDQKVASSAGGWYSGSSRDSGKISVYAIAADGQDMGDVEAKIDAVIAEVKANGVTQAELDRAKKSLRAEYVYQSDSQSSLARRYGWAVTIGQTVEQVDAWPDDISKVTAEQVKAAANKYLDLKSSVTGLLLPEPQPKRAEGQSTAQPAPRG